MLLYLSPCLLLCGPYYTVTIVLYDISSGGISLNSTISNTLARNACLTSISPSPGGLLFVVALLFVKFILFNNDLAQATVNVAGPPPYYASLVRSIAFPIIPQH